MRTQKLLAILIVALLPLSLTAQKKVYVKDVKHANKEIKKLCKSLLKAKKINWSKIGKQFEKEAAKSKSDSEHCRLMIRLVARLEDGHATVEPGASAPQGIVPFPEFKDHTGAAMFLCRIDKKIYIKQAWGAARSAGLSPGMELVSVNGTKAPKWLEERITTHRDVKSFSTRQHAEFYALQRGLTAKKSERWKLVVKTTKGKTKKKTLVFERARQVPDGPAVFPKGTKRSSKGHVNFGKTESGFGYIHIRRCKSNVVAEVDEALNAIGNPKGMILDFRGNTGGSFNHEALFGRFVPKGKTISFNKKYKSAGTVTYGGPIVAIIDGSVASAGETASGMFKEDGRAYVIGEGPTAGMSSGKRYIELPSGKFKLRVSVSSNMGRANKGKGIEGIGIPPHESLFYNATDLANGIDTLTRRAEQLLKDMPKNVVPYQPDQFGWKSQ